MSIIDRAAKRISTPTQTARRSGNSVIDRASRRQAQSETGIIQRALESDAGKAIMSGLYALDYPAREWIRKPFIIPMLENIKGSPLPPDVRERGDLIEGMKATFGASASLADIVPGMKKGSAFDISASGATGLALEVVLDPLNLIGFAGGGSKAMKLTAEAGSAMQKASISRGAINANNIAKVVKGASDDVAFAGLSESEKVAASALRDAYKGAPNVLREGSAEIEQALAKGRPGKVFGRGETPVDISMPEAIRSGERGLGLEVPFTDMRYVPFAETQAKTAEAIGRGAQAVAQLPGVAPVIEGAKRVRDLFSSLSRRNPELARIEEFSKQTINAENENVVRAAQSLMDEIGKLNPKDKAELSDWFYQVQKGENVAENLLPLKKALDDFNEANALMQEFGGAKVTRYAAGSEDPLKLAEGLGRGAEDEIRRIEAIGRPQPEFLDNVIDAGGRTPDQHVQDLFRYMDENEVLPEDLQKIKSVLDGYEKNTVSKAIAEYRKTKPRRSTEWTPEQAAVRDAVKGKTAIEVSDFIAQAGNDLEKTVAFKAGETLRRMEALGFKMRKTGTNPGKYANRPVAGVGGMFEDGIGIELAKSGMNTRTITHELVHAASEAVVKSKNLTPELRAAVDELETLRRTLSETLPEGRPYGLKNTSELLAEAMSNPEFQRLLRETPYGNETMWTKFVDTIRRILGMDEAQSTALDYVLKRGERIMDASDDELRRILLEKPRLKVSEMAERAAPPTGRVGELAQQAQRLRGLPAQIAEEGGGPGFRESGNVVESIAGRLGTLQSGLRRMSKEETAILRRLSQIDDKLASSLAERATKPLPRVADIRDPFKIIQRVSSRVEDLTRKGREALARNELRAGKLAKEATDSLNAARQAEIDDLIKQTEKKLAKLEQRTTATSVSAKSVIRQKKALDNARAELEGLIEKRRIQAESRQFDGIVSDAEIKSARAKFEKLKSEMNIPSETGEEELLRRQFRTEQNVAEGRILDDFEAQVFNIEQKYQTAGRRMAKLYESKMERARKSIDSEFASRTKGVTAPAERELSEIEAGRIIKARRSEIEQATKAAERRGKALREAELLEAERRRLGRRMTGLERKAARKLEDYRRAVVAAKEDLGTIRLDPRRLAAGIVKKRPGLKGIEKQLAETIASALGKSSRYISEKGGAVRLGIGERAYLTSRVPLQATSEAKKAIAETKVLSPRTPSAIAELAVPDDMTRSIRTMTPQDINRLANGDLSIEEHLSNVARVSPQEVPQALADVISVKIIAAKMGDIPIQEQIASGGMLEDMLKAVPLNPKTKAVLFEEDPLVALTRDASRGKRRALQAMLERNVVDYWAKRVIWKGDNVREFSRDELMLNVRKGERLYKTSKDLIEEVNLSDGIKLEKGQSLVVLPEEQAEHLTKLAKEFAPGSGASQVLDMYDKYLLNPFRSMVTAGVVLPSLSFNIRNAVSDMMMAATVGGLNPVNWTQAARLLLLEKFPSAAKSEKFLKSVVLKDGRGKDWTVEELLNFSKQSGLIGRNAGVMRDTLSKQAEELVMKAPGFKDTLPDKLRALNTPARATADMAASWGRLALLMDGLKKGFSPTDAALRVKGTLYDYSQLTSFERDVLRRIFPFYTWMRNNLPKQVENAITKPRTVVPYLTTSGRSMERAGDDGIPDWMKRTLPLVLLANEKDITTMAQKNIVPAADLQAIVSMLQGDDQAVRQFLAENVSGPAFIGIEHYADIDLYRSLVSGKMMYMEDIPKERLDFDFMGMRLRPRKKFGANPVDFFGTLLTKYYRPVREMGKLGQPSERFRSISGIPVSTYSRERIAREQAGVARDERARISSAIARAARMGSVEGVREGLEELKKLGGLKQVSDTMRQAAEDGKNPEVLKVLEEATKGR